MCNHVQSNAHNTLVGKFVWPKIESEFIKTEFKAYKYEVTSSTVTGSTGHRLPARSISAYISVSQTRWIHLFANHNNKTFLVCIGFKTFQSVNFYKSNVCETIFRISTYQRRI